MKYFIFCVISLFFVQRGQAQTAYIQISGESGLDVYLNGKLKGQTRTEFNGLIIDNVSPGKNTIKVVKKGYIPFEESVTIQAGEVFLYKVKEFKKNVIPVYQEGNSAQTTQVETLPSGKLIIQSIPIEMKIRIETVDGVNTKNKDQWVAEKFPEGTYAIEFEANGKTIKKSVTIYRDETTKLFINMLNGEMKTEMVEREAKIKENLQKEKDIAARQAAYKIQKEQEYKAIQTTIGYLEENKKSWKKGALWLVPGVPLMIGSAVSLKNGNYLNGFLLGLPGFCASLYGGLSLNEYNKVNADLKNAQAQLRNFSWAYQPTLLNGTYCHGVGMRFNVGNTTNKRLAFVPKF